MAAASKPVVPVTRAGDLMLLLQKRYPSREYAFLQEVPNATGFAVRRHADAVALSLWPSRGLVLHGFEIKVSRTDWLRELKNPQKADDIARFCDFWWLVVGSGPIVQPGELPATWGLLAPSPDGSTLRVVQQPTKLEAEPWTRAFMAAVLRKAGESMVPTASVEAVKAEAERKGFERGKSQSSDTVVARELDQLRTLKAEVEAFEAASGIELQWRHEGGRRVGEAVDAVLRSRNAHDRFVSTLRDAAKYLGGGLESNVQRLRLQIQALQTQLSEDADRFAAIQPDRAD